EDLQLENEPFDGTRFYAHIKRAQVALNRTWAERFPADQIAFHPMHPGVATAAGRARAGTRPGRLARESSGPRAGYRRLLAGPRAAARAPHPFDPRDPPGPRTALAGV